MKYGKKIVMSILSCFMVVSNMHFVYAQESTNQGRNLKQQTIQTIANMPQIPSQFQLIDWKQRGRDLDRFLFDYSATNNSEKTIESVNKDRKFATIYKDDTYGGYMIPAFYGEDRPLNNANNQESIAVTSALIAATLLGIDKNVELPDDINGEGTSDDSLKALLGEDTKLTYLDSALKFYWTKDGANVFTNVPNGSDSLLQNKPGVYQAFGDYWYMLIANQNFFRLAALNPDWRTAKIQELQKNIAEKMCDMVDVLGGENCDFNIQGFDMINMESVGTSWRQPDAAAGTANILYYAYKIFKEEKYLTYAKYCMDYLEGLERNPYYENMLIDASYVAAMMNAEVGTDYNVSKYLNWITQKSSVRDWGGVNYTQNGVDVTGLTGSPNNSYAFFFNSIYPMTSILPTAKYDPSYAKTAGKWALNIASNSRYFLPSELEASHQTNPEFKGKIEENVLAYEGFKKISNDKDYGVENGTSLVGTGDAKCNATTGWQAGKDATNLGIYGSVYTGILGALVEETNVENILRLDCNKTDYYQTSMYPTYLYYNPHQEAKDVEIKLDKAYDVFDSTTGLYLAKNVSGTYTMKMLADSARVIVLAPANSSVEFDGYTTKINGVLVSHSDAEVLDDAGSELIQSIEIQGTDEITQKDQEVKYQVVLTPSDNLMDPRVTWSLTNTDGNVTDKAVVSKDGVLTAKKNGTVILKATSIDGSQKFAEKTIIISGQTLASLSQGKTTVTSSVGDNHPGSLAVDGDISSRWIANPNEANPWIYVDLGAKANIDSIVLNWEAARPPRYEIQVTDDPSQGNWQQIENVEDEGNSAKVVRFQFDGQTAARYVRIYANQKSRYGCSLYEFDVYGRYQIDEQITSIVVKAENDANKITTKNRPLQMYADINPENATDQRVEWYVFNQDGSDTNLAEIDSSGKLIPKQNGIVQVVAKAVDGSNVQGEINITIENQDKENLAYQKTAYASNQEGANPAQNAFDGKTETRWASGQKNDSQWITVDLGDIYNVNKVVLYWEAYASEYKIQGSADNREFTDLYIENSGKGGVEEKTFAAQPVRYVRMQCVKRSGEYGSSLWEFQVYGDTYEKTYVDSIKITSESGVYEIVDKNKPLQLTAAVTPTDATIPDVEWFVYDQDGHETDLATISKDGQVIPKGNGTVKVVAMATDGSSVTSDVIITIKNQDIENIAYNKTTMESSHTDNNSSDKAVDGDQRGTRWVSTKNNDEYMIVDLGSLYYIHQVSMYWEAAFAKKYEIQGSVDGQDYFPIHNEQNGKGGLENIYIEETLVRYVKMQGIERATTYGYSLYEFEIYGKSYKDNLQKLYDQYQVIDGKLYTPDSYQKLEDALLKADVVLKDDNASEFNIKETEKLLEEAYAQLIKRIDKTSLQNLITKALQINQQLYTPQSVKTLQDALKTAQSIYDNQNATQQQVTEVYDLLNSSLNHLMKRANMQELKKTIDKAENIKADDYTTQSFQELQQKLIAAKKVYENKNATQQSVDQALQALMIAFNSLVEKPIIDIKPEEPIQDVTVQDDHVTIVGKLPQNIQLSTVLLTQEQCNEIINQMKKMNPQFFNHNTIEKIFDIQLLFNGVQYNIDGTVDVSIKLDENLKNKKIGVIYIDDQGRIQVLESSRQGDYIHFKTTHFSKYAIVSYSQDDEDKELPVTEDLTSVYQYSILLGLSVLGIYGYLKKKRKVL